MMSRNRCKMPSTAWDTEKLLDSKEPFVFVLLLKKIRCPAESVSVLPFSSTKVRIFYYD